MFLNTKKAATNQNLKFLATSVWLESKGKKRLKPSDVSLALKEANRKKLGNPSECLRQNVSSGCCERDGNEYFVTAEGRAKLGV